MTPITKILNNVSWLILKQLVDNAIGNNFGDGIIILVNI